MTRFPLSAVVLLASVAAAAPLRPLRLEYKVEPASATCPDEAAFRSAVAARLGVDPFDANAAAALQISIQPAAPGHRAEVALVDEAGVRKSRQLSGTRADCADLREALALSSSVAVEAFTASPPAVPVVVEPPPPAPVPAPAPPPPPQPPPPPPPVLIKPIAVLGGGLALGVAPSPTGVLWIGGGLQHRFFSVALEGRFQIPAGTVVDSGRIDVGALSLELVPCFELRPLKVCALAAGGAVRSWATNLDGAREVTSPLAVLGGRVELTFPVFWRLFVSALGEVRGALVQTALRVGNRDVWVTPAVGGVVGFAFTLRWDVTDLP